MYRVLFNEFEINEYKKFLILTSETLEFDIEISDKLLVFKFT